jgi:hypothetical protein
LSTPEKKAVTFASPPQHGCTPLPELRLKKGMVIVNRSLRSDEVWPKGYAGFMVVLDDEAAMQSLVVGSDVIVYIASVRTVARLVSVDPPPRVAVVSDADADERRPRESVDMFGFDDEDDEGDEESGSESSELVKRRFSFELLFGVEWMELGAKVLVMKSGAGMEVFVGKVVDRICGS